MSVLGSGIAAITLIGMYGVEVNEIRSFQAAAQSDWWVKGVPEDHRLREED